MSQPDIPAAPDPAETYRQGANISLEVLPRFLAAEQDARSQYDPQRVYEQQMLQEFFGPNQYRQQLDALNQLDPESSVIRRQLAGRVSHDLASGINLPADYSRELDTQFRGAQAARGNTLGASAGSAEAGFKGRAAQELYQQHLTDAGNFLSGPTPESQISLIQGVQPDRSSAYTNPNAGTQGQNFALNNYQNILAQQQLAGGGRNPWAGAAGGAAQGAATGAQAGGGWGALVGGVLGGVGGYFSDSRLKQDIKEIGDSGIPGIPVIQFRYKAYPQTLFQGVRAEDAQKFKPDCVSEESGYLKVDYRKLGIPFMEVHL